MARVVIFCQILLIFVYYSPLSESFYSKTASKNACALHEVKMNALSSIIKKSKLKEVQDILADMEQQKGAHILSKFIANGDRAPKLPSTPPSFFNATKSSTTITKQGVDMGTYTLSVIAEYTRKAQTGFIFGLPAPQIMGGVLRDAGTKGIIVSIDKKSGGVTVAEAYEFATEQNRALKWIPGPLPIIWNDFIVDNIQITQAAAFGASAIVLSPGITNDIASQVKYCNDVGLEPIVMVKSEEEAKSAIEAGARCLCLHTLTEEGLLSLRSKLPTSGLLLGAKLRSEQDFSTYSEIDTAWVLRDNRFDFVWPSPEAVYATEMSDVYSCIQAMRAKAGRLFISPRQYLMDRKREGAKEYLGEIAD